MGFRCGAADLARFGADRFGPVSDRWRPVRTDVVGNKMATGRPQHRTIFRRERRIALKLIFAGLISAERGTSARANTRVGEGDPR
jgi:hypothetical protein